MMCDKHFLSIERNGKFIFKVILALIFRLIKIWLFILPKAEKLRSYVYCSYMALNQNIKFFQVLTLTSELIEKQFSDKFAIKF